MSTMQDQRRWLSLLAGNDGVVISHLVFIAINSLSDDLIAARRASAVGRALHMSALEAPPILARSAVDELTQLSCLLTTADCGRSQVIAP